MLCGGFTNCTTIVLFAEVSEQVAEALSSNGTSIGANGVAKHITHANGIKLEESLAQTSLPTSQPRR